MDVIRLRQVLSIPNLLTLLRIVLLPVIVLRYLQGDSNGALLVYLFAMLTDAADGLIARKCGQITALGKLLDPLADKLCLLTLMYLFAADGQLPLWIPACVLIKELILIAGSIFALNHGIVVYALPVGKVTTAAFITSTAARFMEWRRLADVLLGISLTLSMLALAWYTIVLFQRIQSEKQSFIQRIRIP